MSITTLLSSQKPISQTNLHETLIHRSHANLPFNPISGFPIRKTTVITPLTTTAARRNSMIAFAAAGEPAAPPPPPPPSSSSGSWKNWVIGILMTFIVPAFTTKGGPIKLLMLKVDQIVDTAEHITDVVEAVADKVDKVVEELGDNLPEGSEIKKTLDFIENIAEKVEKDAHTAGDFIDKRLDSPESRPRKVVGVREVSSAATAVTSGYRRCSGSSVSRNGQKRPPPPLLRRNPSRGIRRSPELRLENTGTAPPPSLSTETTTAAPPPPPWLPESRLCRRFCCRCADLEVYRRESRERELGEDRHRRPWSETGRCSAGFSSDDEEEGEESCEALLFFL
ncbi:hypothetical protein SSX86_032380 [Deinandra increscens subsp. villosa]|uniref:Uncharacterized protein n=1 Tax=Deinandra increscens subsp. villosa TaxID=3103831 RepID=A0AAP0C7T5_9ASTR